MPGFGKPLRPYRVHVQIRHFTTGPWVTVYTGPWDTRAAYVYKNSPGLQRRVMRAFTDADIMAMFYGHPDLIELEAYLDAFYVVPGDQNDPPNRTADPEIRAAVRRRAAPFDLRAESFWPARFDPDAIGDQG